MGNTYIILSKNIKKREKLGDLGVGGIIILKMHPKETVCKDVDLIHLVQDGAQWRTM
jgi:hypothetical protein